MYRRSGVYGRDYATREDYGFKPRKRCFRCGGMMRSDFNRGIVWECYKCGNVFKVRRRY